MQEIKDLAEDIEEELCDSEKYADKAMKTKSNYPSLAANYLKLSIEEMGHAALLHTEVVNMIEEYRKEHGDPPERMLGRYDYIHEKFIEKSNHIKALQIILKGEIK